MIVSGGCKILVAHRRLFESDSSRFFAGIVEAYEDGIARVLGYSFMADPAAESILQKEDKRTKIFSISSGTLLIYVLPEETELDDLRIELAPGLRVFLTDGKDLRMDLTDRH